MRLLSIAILQCALIAPTSNAFAQDSSSEWQRSSVIAIGVGAGPEHDGADGLRILPFVYGDINIDDVRIQARGQGLRVDLVRDPRLSIGPVIGARLPRDLEEGPVALLPEIGMAIEAGGFVGYRFGGDATGKGSLQLELSMVHDISDTHRGFVATASASYAAILTTEFFLSVDTQTSWASADYTQTYFGIDNEGAADSGLAAYDPGAGFRDIGAGLTAGCRLTQRLGLILRGGVSYLVGDAANSPVALEGRRWQPTVGLGLSYRF